MARPKKQTIQEDKSNEVFLSEEDVNYVLNFARAMNGNGMAGLLTPDLVSLRLKDNSFSPVVATEAELIKALKSPLSYEKELRSYIEAFEINSMPFKRILSYLASLPAFDLTYTVKNTKSIESYGEPKFKKDKEIIFEFLDKFEYEYSFRNMLKQLLRNEVVVFTVRDDQDSEKIILQELPLNYCKITAQGEYSLLASFDFDYFSQPGVDINLFPDFFKRKSNQLADGKGRNSKYNPSIEESKRGLSIYNSWVDLPPEVAWVFKLDTSQTATIPYFSGLMLDFVHQGTIRTLQKDYDMSVASKILMGQVPLLKDNKADLKDMLAIDPATLGQFLALVKSSLSSSIKVAAAPLEQMQALTFEGDAELYDNYLRTAMSSSGMDTNLIFSSSLKNNVTDSQLSFEADGNLICQMFYPQCNLFMEFHAAKKTKNYKYAFEFEGIDYYTDRASRFENANSLMTTGILLPQKLSAAIGMKPQNFFRMLEESKAMKFSTEWITPIVSAFQQSGKNPPANGKDEGGRPKEAESKLGESGSQTRGSGANVAKKSK